MTNVKPLITTIALTIASVLQIHAQLSVTDGLVGYYQFNGNANDSSGNGNNGLLTKGYMITDRFGSPQSAIGFSTVPNGIAGVLTTQQQSPGNHFSLSLWFRTSPGNGGQLISFGDTQTGQNFQSDRNIEINGGTGQADFYVFPGYQVYLVAPDYVTDQEWHSVVATLSLDGMKLYLDGQTAANEPTVTTAEAFNGYWQIGNCIADIDDVRIYNRALSSDEVMALYQIEAVPEPTSMSVLSLGLMGIIIWRKRHSLNK